MSRGLPRVLVLTGTSEHPFPRLLSALPALVRDGFAAEVRVQSAVPVPPAPGITPLGMLSRDALRREIEEADVVITHGGSGSCFDAVRAGHRPIVVPRRADLGELMDDHQADVAAALLERGLAVVLTEPEPAALARRVSEARREGPRRGPSSLGERLRRGLRSRAALRRPASPALFARRAEASAYAAFFRACPHPHPLQSAAWGEARRQDGWTPEWWLASAERGRPLAGAQVLRRGGRLVPGYLPFGPVVSDDAEGARAAQWLLRRLARVSVAGLLWAPSADPEHRAMAARGGAIVLAPSSQTGIVPLGSDEELLARLRGKWRWSLKKALKDGNLILEWDEPKTFTPEILRRVHALAAKKGFPPPIREQVGVVFAARAEESGVRLVGVTSLADQGITNSYLACVVGTTARTLWTAHEERADEGSGRVALWAILRRCRDLGASLYDVSGIDDEGNPGVASFKRGLRPEIVEVPGLRWLPPALVPPAIARAVAEAAARVLR